MIIVASILWYVALSDNTELENSNIENESTNQSNLVDITNPNSLFITTAEKEDFYTENGELAVRNANFELIPEFGDLYNEIGVWNSKQKTIVIVPIFTTSAYGKNGFYDYYDLSCESCTTTKILDKSFLDFKSSVNAVKILGLLGYKMITDMDLNNNPNILKNYDKVILLHSEYVTQKMFDSITTHPNVIYFYPNALYAEIEVNNNDNTITLIRGHGYPDQSISNGFDWQYDNTHPFEFDLDCDNWEFYKIENGMMLNCYPEHKIAVDKFLLKAIKEM